MAGDLPDWTSRTSLAPIPLAALSLAAGATGATVQLNPPDSATGLMLMLAPVGYPGTIFLQGAVTGYEYLSSVTIGANEGGPVPVWIPADADGPYTLTVDFPTRPGTAPAQVVVIVYAFMGGGFSGVVGSTFSPVPVAGVVGGQPLPVIGVAGGEAVTAFISGGNLASPQGVQGVQGPAGNSVQNVPEPPADGLAILAGLTASTVYHLLAGTAGKSVRPRKGTLQWSGTTTGYILLKSTSGVPLGYFAPITTVPIPVDFEGRVLPAGDGIDIQPTSLGVSLSLLGFLDYDLA